jgi:tetratricopeptide (TPR) repeat protein
MNPMLPYKVLYFDWKRRDCNTPILPPRRTPMWAGFSSAYCVLTILVAAPGVCDVRVWQDSQTLPTYQETLPDTTPPFSVYSPGEPTVYPYTMRTGFTKKRIDHGWRTLRLENEYLSCIVLPDLGGRLYSCKDKLNGQEMFHLNPSIKKAFVGLRGAWIETGIEMNFPLGHTWVTVSPVDFATAQNSDGSASIWVGGIDRVYGMQWRVEFVLRPGSTILEQNVVLENPSAIRHRYYWWNNAGIARVDDKTRFIYPTNLAGTHMLTEIDTWPVNSAGVDMSVVGNHRAGGVALFAHGSREPFMAVYHPSLRTGTVHYADAKAVPGKKVWSWGLEGDKWVIAELADDNKSFIEMQAGLFENQETYKFLEPGESRKFSEYWMPVRGLGGVSRANLEGVLNLSRTAAASEKIQLVVEFNANHKIAGAKLRVTDDANAVLEETANLDPASTYTKTLKELPAGARYSFQLLDSAGKVLFSHTEDQYDARPAKGVKLGPQPKTDLSVENAKTPGEFLKLGEYNELQGRLGFARDNYLAALKRFPNDVEVNRAAGRFALAENRFEQAVTALTAAQAAAPDDAELHYYLGVAYAALGDDAKARKELQAVGPQNPLHAAANLALAGTLARAQDHAGALKTIESTLAERPDMVRAGAMEIGLLRRLSQTEKAQRELARFRAIDPTDVSLRYEQTRLGKDDRQLWPHLGADPEQVLNVAIGYMDLGMYEDALDLLARKYPPPIDILATEPGAVLPQYHPLVGYYRAYCLTRLGHPATKELAEASGYFTEYVFPNRPSTFPVLQSALKQNPADSTALFLLGELYMAGAEVDKAIDAWEQARQAGFKRAELYRELGRAWTELKKDSKKGLAVFEEGLKVAPTDPQIQKGVQTLFGPIKGPKALAASKALFDPSIPTAPSLPNATSSEKVQLATPEAGATYALGLAAEGKLEDAARVFDPVNFPGEKQAETVREAYMEIQVQSVLALARNRRCSEAIAAEDRLGDENPALPFTFHSFGAILRGLRMQYNLATLEVLCGNEKGARKIWSKLAKAQVKDISDPDFSIPFVAAATLGQEGEVKARSEAALAQIKGAFAGNSNRATLLYSQGMLLRTLGREKDAQSSFADALGANPPPMIGYLALVALRRR